MPSRAARKSARVRIFWLRRRRHAIISRDVKSRVIPEPGSSGNYPARGDGLAPGVQGSAQNCGAARNQTPESASRGVDSPHAWLIAVTAFFSCFVVYGVQYSFGAFFKSIAADMGATRADTATIFSVNMFVANLFGAVAGYLGDRFGPRPLIAGAALATGLADWR